MNKKTTKRSKNILRSIRGQSTAEYVLILAIVVMLVMQFRRNFVSKIGDTSGKLGDQIDRIIGELDEQ